MTKVINEDMKGTPVPGLDGLTVNFIWAFWDSLGVLVVNAVYDANQKIN